MLPIFMDTDPDAQTRFLVRDMDVEQRSQDIQWSVFSKWFSDEEWQKLSESMMPDNNEQKPTAPPIVVKEEENSPYSDSPSPYSDTTPESDSSDVNLFSFPSAVLPESSPSGLFQFSSSDISHSKITTKKAPILNSKGNKKSDHELREEFYRKQFRKQTNNRDPPRFFPSRSAHDESFIWRPEMNKRFNINIPVYRKINGKLDDEKMLASRKRARPTNLASDTEKLLKIPKLSKGMFRNAVTQTKIVCAGDIAYYFRKSKFIFYDPDTDEELGSELEVFEAGDVVAVLSDGTVTKDTSLANVQFVSVVPGDPGDAISPWKTFPDPPPDNLEEYQLVVMLGIAYVKIEAPSTCRLSSCLVIPSGSRNGEGVVIPKENISDEDNRFSQVIGLPVEDSSSCEDDRNQILIVRNGQIYQPIIAQLLTSMFKLRAKTDRHSKEIKHLTKRIEELQKQIQESPKLPVNTPKETEIVELYPSRLLILIHRKTRAKIKCTPLRDLADCDPTIWGKLGQNGKAIVTVPWKPHEIMTAENPDGSFDTLTSVLVFDMIAINKERRCFAFQKRSCWKPNDIDKIRDGDFEHRLNGTFCEYIVNGRFCLRLMRVIRKPNFRASSIIKTLFNYTHPPTQGFRCSGHTQWIKRHVFEKLLYKKDSPGDEMNIEKLIETGQWNRISALCIRSSHTVSSLSNDQKNLISAGLKEEVLQEIAEDQNYLLTNGISTSVLPNFDDDPLDERVESWARYFIALQPLDSNVKPCLYQLESILFAVTNNPFLCWKWSKASNVYALRPCIGWGEPHNFPHNQESNLALHIFCNLLQYGPILRKLGPELVIPQATAAKLIADKQSSETTLMRAFKILSFFARDPFLRTMLLEYSEILALFSDKFKSSSAEMRRTVEQMKDRLTILPFTGIYVDDDVSATIPFSSNLPSPDPSFMDKPKNLLLMLTFRDISLYTTDDYVHFWIKFPLPVKTLAQIKSLKKTFLNIEFLDTHRPHSPWRVAVVCEGQLYNSIHESPTNKSQPWWVSVVSLKTPTTNKDQQDLWTQNDVPKDGIVIVFLGDRASLKESCTIGLGTLQIK